MAYDGPSNWEEMTAFDANAFLAHYLDEGTDAGSIQQLQTALTLVGANIGLDIEEGVMDQNTVRALFDYAKSYYPHVDHDVYGSGQDTSITSLFAQHIPFDELKQLGEIAGTEYIQSRPLPPTRSRRAEIDDNAGDVTTPNPLIAEQIELSRQGYYAAQGALYYADGMEGALTTHARALADEQTGDEYARDYLRRALADPLLMNTTKERMMIEAALNRLAGRNIHSVNGDFDATTELAIDVFRETEGLNRSSAPQAITSAPTYTGPISPEFRLVPRRPADPQVSGAVILNNPLDGQTILDTFHIRDIHPVTGERNVPHRGVDLRTRNLRGDDRDLRTENESVVAYAGQSNGYGNIVVLYHGQGIYSMYAHLDRDYVSTGDVLDAGERFGRVGNSGRGTGEHLHHEIWIERDGIAYTINPESAWGENLADRGVQERLLEESRDLLGNRNTSATYVSRVSPNRSSLEEPSQNTVLASNDIPNTIQSLTMGAMSFQADAVRTGHVPLLDFARSVIGFISNPTSLASVNNRAPALAFAG